MRQAHQQQPDHPCQQQPRRPSEAAHAQATRKSKQRRTSSSTLTGPEDADGKQPWPAAKQAQLRHHTQAAEALAGKRTKLRPLHKFALSDDAKGACVRALHGAHAARLGLMTAWPFL